MRFHIVKTGVYGVGMGMGGGLGGMTPAQIYQTAVGAGFPADVAVKMTAISLRETGGTGNTNAFYGGTPAHPEASYGLWQINYNDPGVKQVAQSVGVTDPNQLFDPEVNARVAFALYGGNPNNLNVAWYIDKGGAYTAGYQQWLPVAEQAAGVTVDDSVTPAGDTPVDSNGDPVEDPGTTDNTALLIAGAAAGVIALMALSR